MKECSDFLSFFFLLFFSFFKLMALRRENRGNLFFSFSVQLVCAF